MRRIGLWVALILALSIGAGATTVDLLAGQFYNAGFVEVFANEEMLTIYIFTDNGWALDETHIYVGTVAPKKSAPGQFPYKHEDLGNALFDVYEISLSDYDVVCGNELFIAVHAVVKGIDNEYGEETAWGAGDFIRADKNWAMYFTEAIECDYPLPQ